MSAPWAVQYFGYTAGLPWGDDPLVADPSPGAIAPSRELAPVGTRGHARLSFHVARWIGVSKAARHPVVCQGRLYVQRVGPHRQLLTIVGRAPNLDRRLRVLRVGGIVDGLTLGTIVLTDSEPARPHISHAVLGGDPFAFTFDDTERRALRRALTRVEEQVLPGEVRRVTVLGLPEELLATSSVARLCDAASARGEIERQLRGAMRAEQWAYLFRSRGIPHADDAPKLLRSVELTGQMYETLSNLGETIVRALGLKPAFWSQAQEMRAFELVTWAVVALKCGAAMDEVVERVVREILGNAKRSLLP